MARGRTGRSPTLQESGCRPGEVMKVKAADVDLAAGTWVLRGKDFEATGELRTIYLTTALSELTRRLVARQPIGPLFRNKDGRPWTRHAIRNRFQRKKDCKRGKKIDKGVTAYTYRHSFITDALANGLPEKVVAELVGHRSTAMMANYAHLDTKEELRRRAAAAAVRSGDAPTTGRPPAAGGGGGWATPSQGA